MVGPSRTASMTLAQVSAYLPCIAVLSERADVAAAYPNATGHDNGVEENMPLFETSTLFILLYAYQKFSGDTSFAQQYLPLLQGYAEYLAANSLYPASQLISVDAIPATANQTALAIQSTIALNAASILTGNKTYATLATSFASTIYNDALGLNGATVSASTHFTYNYGEDTTWNVLFASYSDFLLDLGTFPSAAWEMQSTWYASQMQELGLPFAGPATDLNYTGSPINWGLSDWSKSIYPLLRHREPLLLHDSLRPNPLSPLLLSWHQPY